MLHDKIQLKRPYLGRKFELAGGVFFGAKALVIVCHLSSVVFNSGSRVLITRLRSATPIFISIDLLQTYLHFKIHLLVHQSYSISGMS